MQASIQLVVMGACLSPLGGARAALGTSTPAARLLHARIRDAVHLPPGRRYATLIDEYLRFIIMKITARSPSAVVPSPLIEAVWATHVTFTRLYEEFCIRMCARCKQPVVHVEHEAEAAHASAAYEHTLFEYVRVFRRVPPYMVWPQQDALNAALANAVENPPEAPPTRPEEPPARIRPIAEQPELRRAIRAATHLPPGPDDDALVAEYDRFFQMMALGSKVLVPSAPVDEVWRAHIAHTRHYRESCKAAGVGAFLHYVLPDPESDLLYQRTLVEYVLAFDALPPHRWWPRCDEYEAPLARVLAGCPCDGPLVPSPTVRPAQQVVSVAVAPEEGWGSARPTSKRRVPPGSKAALRKGRSYGVTVPSAPIVEESKVRFGVPDPM